MDWLASRAADGALVASFLLLLVVAARSDRGSFRFVVAVAAAALALAALGYSAFTIDDAYISLRYARNLAAGHGLTFNTDGSPPFEGYSNPSWVVLGALLYRTGLSDAGVVTAVKAVDLLCGIGTVVLAAMLARRLHGSENAGRLTAILVAASPFLAIWSIGGLETPLYACLLLAALLRYDAEVRQRFSHTGTGGLLLLAALTRPEGVLTGLLALVAVPLAEAWRREDSWRASLGRTAPAVGVLLIGSAVHTAWRLMYYGTVWPNSMLAKTVPMTVAHLRWRVDELAPLAFVLAPIVVVALIGERRRQRLSPSAGALAGALLGQMAFVFVPAFEAMPGFRYQVPAIVLLTVAMSGRLAAVLDGLGGARRRTTMALVAMVLVATVVAPGFDLRREREIFPDQVEIDFALWLRMYAPTGSYSGYDMDLGTTAFYSHLPRMIELAPHGLLAPRPGESRYDVTALLAERPAFVGLPRRDLLPPRDHAHSIYTHPAFAASYVPVCRLWHAPNFQSDIFKEQSVILSPEAVAALRQLEAHSYDIAFARGAADGIFLPRPDEQKP